MITGELPEHYRFELYGETIPNERPGFPSLVGLTCVAVFDGDHMLVDGEVTFQDGTGTDTQPLNMSIFSLNPDISIGQSITEYRNRIIEGLSHEGYPRASLVSQVFVHWVREGEVGHYYDR